MRTGIENYFYILWNSGFADEESGGTDAPTGAFAYFVVTEHDSDLLEASSVADLKPSEHGLAPGDIVGFWTFRLNEFGDVAYERFNTVNAAREKFEEWQEDYAHWCNSFA